MGLEFTLGVEYDFNNKLNCIENHTIIMINRLCSMFEFKGFPKTIDTRQLFKHLIVNGSVAFFKDDNGLFWRDGSAGGQLDNDYNPTIYTLASPYLNVAKKFNIGTECVVVYSDSMRRGLQPLLNKYATLLAENELSLYQATINTRIPFIITASDDDTKTNADLFIDDVKRGKLTCILDKDFNEQIKVNTVQGGDGLLQALTDRQIFLEGKFWNEIGLNANWNSKKESLASDEVGVNSECLLPLIDDILFNFKKGLKAVNKLFGASLSVDFSSAWKMRTSDEDCEKMKKADEVKNDEQN